MPLIRITADADTPRLFASPAALSPVLASALRHPHCGTGPVVIMVHGFKYHPGHARHCPHRAILSLDPAQDVRRGLSWPRHLGFGQDRADEGLALAFGWPARGSIWRACRSAEQAGTALARLVALLRRHDPARPIHIIAHSLGARVALASLAQSARGDIDKLLLLTGAEFTATALNALATPGGRTARVLNITSRENDLFDFLMERAIAPPRPGDQMLGLGQARAPNLVTLELDAPATLTRLRGAGFAIAPPTHRICHWSAYLRPGVFPLYRAVLDDTLPFHRLRSLIASDPAPRWSRLRPTLGLPLPFLSKPS